VRPPAAGVCQSDRASGLLRHAEDVVVPFTGRRKSASQFPRTDPFPDRLSSRRGRRAVHRASAAANPWARIEAGPLTTVRPDCRRRALQGDQPLCQFRNRYRQRPSIVLGPHGKPGQSNPSERIPPNAGKRTGRTYRDGSRTVNPRRRGGTQVRTTIMTTDKGVSTRTGPVRIRSQGSSSQWVSSSGGCFAGTPISNTPSQPSSRPARVQVQGEQGAAAGVVQPVAEHAM